MTLQYVIYPRPDQTYIIHTQICMYMYIYICKQIWLCIACTYICHETLKQSAVRLIKTYVPSRRNWRKRGRQSHWQVWCCSQPSLENLWQYVRQDRHCATPVLGVDFNCKGNSMELTLVRLEWKDVQSLLESNPRWYSHLGWHKGMQWPNWETCRALSVCVCVFFPMKGNWGPSKDPKPLRVTRRS